MLGMWTEISVLALQFTTTMSRATFYNAVRFIAEARLYHDAVPRTNSCLYPSFLIVGLTAMDPCTDDPREVCSDGEPACFLHYGINIIRYSIVETGGARIQTSGP
ncbi:hypothetical protein LZ30DRAFT_241694 [Colletotrichum cereale]|nr:hypothetical protein LZ30DRAFT_241694 [Colletotrichum cereale]